MLSPELPDSEMDGYDLTGHLAAQWPELGTVLRLRASAHADPPTGPNLLLGDEVTE